MSRVGVISWGCREQPDIDDLKATLKVVSGGTVTCAMAHTRSDEYALVVSSAPIDEQEATKVFDWWWVPPAGDADRLETFDWPPVGSSGAAS